MRRLIGAAVVLLILASLTFAASCRPKTYTDGTYQAVSQADTHGYAWAKVTIARDKITAVELKEVTELGVEKNFATYPYPEAKVAFETMPGRFVQKNSWDVDIVARATNSSNKYKEAVKFALEKGRRTPTIKTAYFSGVFQGMSAGDTHGYGIVRVTIQNDAITDVYLDEVVTNAEGQYELKDWVNYVHQPAVAARAEMAGRFKAATPATVANVNVIAQATSSCNKWKQAVQNALANAKVR